MKSTLFRISLMLAAAFSACATWPAKAAESVVSVYRAGKAWLVGHFEVAVKTFTKPEHLPAPAVKFVAAMAYVMRQAKRARPTVTPRWRMCPSA